MDADAKIATRLVAGLAPGREPACLLALFPDEREGSGVSVPQRTLLEWSPLYDELYGRVLPVLAGSLAGAAGVSPKAAAVLARDAGVPILHFFLDRSLRLDLLLRGEVGRALAVPAGACALPDGIEAFRDRAASCYELNQEALARLAPAFGLEVEPGSETTPPPAAAAARAINHNFEGTGLIGKLRRTVFELLGRLRDGRERLPALSMAYHTEPLKEAGFYASQLRELRGRLALAAAPRDTGLRARSVDAAVESCAESVRSFLSRAGMSDSLALAQIPGLLARFAAEAWPTSHLECAAENIRRAAALLAPHAPKPLIYAESNGTEACIMTAAARTLGMPVVGVQHGGHYGYIDDLSSALDLEMPNYDRFVSWGWTGLPPRSSYATVPVTPLPSPWLDARRHRWGALLPAAERRPQGKPFDFLLMTNKVYRFSPAPSGAAVSRCDRLVEYAVFLKELTREAAAAELSLLHKPFNESTRSLFAGTLAELERIGGPFYRTHERLDKGLTAELLRRCGAVLWDQPGTGFLECLVAGLPSFVLWPRLYCQEEPRRRALFEELETAGYVHRRAAGLMSTYKDFRSDPEGWSAQPARAAARKRFLDAVAWEGPDWRPGWAALLQELARGA